MKDFRTSAILFTITLLSFNVASAQQSQLEYNPDYQAVHAAILDYVEGLYSVNPDRIVRSVDPELRKRGYWYNPKEKAYQDNLDMTFEQLKSLAGSWNKDGKQATDQSVKIIQIFDINDKTASAKLTAEWGIDYFHLSKVDGRWKIMNVLWQSIKE